MVVKFPNSMLVSDLSDVLGQYGLVLHPTHPGSTMYEAVPIGAPRGALATRPATPVPTPGPERLPEAPERSGGYPGLLPPLAGLDQEEHKIITNALNHILKGEDPTDPEVCLDVPVQPLDYVKPASERQVPGWLHQAMINLKNFQRVFLWDSPKQNGGKK